MQPAALRPQVDRQPHAECLLPLQRLANRLRYLGRVFQVTAVVHDRHYRVVILVVYELDIDVERNPLRDLRRERVLPANVNREAPRHLIITAEGQNWIKPLPSLPIIGSTGKPVLLQSASSLSMMIAVSVWLNYIDFTAYACLFATPDNIPGQLSLFLHLNAVELHGFLFTSWYCFLNK